MRLKQHHHLALLARWQSLGHALHDAPPEQPVDMRLWQQTGHQLLRAWSHWPRHYHDAHHLHACLRHLDRVPETLENRTAVELALWFHDAVYWPSRPRNEELSAEWAGRFLRRAGMGDTLCQLVENHILATKHHAQPSPGDQTWLVDIDLAILGQSEQVYQAFERNVRAEYRFVRWPRYAIGRSQVLRSFLERPRIYGSDFFHGQFETAARHNLTHSLQALACKRPPTPL